MEKRLKAIARKLWPEIETLSGSDYVSGLFNVTGFLYVAPLTLVGLVWLMVVTDLTLIRIEWPMLFFLLIMLFVFERLDFYFFVEIMPGFYADWQASFTSVIVWSAALMFGHSGLWLSALYGFIYYARRWRQSPSTERRWSCARNFCFNLVEIFTSLVALTLYAHWADGNAFPLPGLALDTVLLAFCATFVWWLLPAIIWVPLLIIFERFRLSASAKDSQGTRTRFWVGALGWPMVVGPFAVLAVGLYAQNGVGGYIFFISGLLLASLLAHHLSQAVERSQQRSRELEKLEQLGRAILNAPPDASTLPNVLEEHVIHMFPFSLIEIYIEHDPLFPAQTLLHHLAQGALVSHDRLSVSAPTWKWLLATSEAHYFLPGKALPWGEQLTSDAVAAVPILDVESAESIGGICILRSWQPETIASLLPAVQSLAAQVASALHRARIYAQELDKQRVEQELALAWQIQASFLPDDLPKIPGWQLAATLTPARETSGDFYDVIPLSNGKLGILIADVADKGMAAALYMALSRTLIRTYADEYDTQPELALSAANRRILTDTRADLFVTVFYGILDPATGTLTYCNAGHNPPYLLDTQNGDLLQEMRRTGMALGVIEDVIWEQKVVQIAPGDVLVLYTDGVTDAQNAQEVLFGEEQLLEVVRANVGAPADQNSPTGQGFSAQSIHEALTIEIQKFVSDAPQFDDLTLMILVRESLLLSPKHSLEV
ncbi:MAG: PP2C family protein-serine/threonine phosphatase [Chloroflexi bacterium]|nr:PP2C family protein-serine/threonine phosphatase [Chloroflexota bacterium]